MTELLTLHFISQSINKSLGGKQWSFILFYCGNLLNGCSYRSVLVVLDTVGCVHIPRRNNLEFSVGWPLFLNWRTCKKHAYNFLDSCESFAVLHLLHIG